MIYYFTPYSIEKNIGKAYNQHMSLLPKDNDWGVLTDGDIMLFDDWGHQIAEMVKKLPDAGIITCMTNRISKKKTQLYGEESTDIIVHRLIAKKLNDQFRGQYRKANQRISGFLMAIKKSTWKEVGKFPEYPGQILDIDGAFSRKILTAGKEIYVMRGMYVLHYYRMYEGKKYKDHLRDAETYIARPKRKITRSAQRNYNIIKKRRR